MTKFRHSVSLLFVLATLFPPLLHAQGRAECSVVQSQILARPVRYCAFLPASFDQDKTRQYPVVYYLHGLGDNEQSLLNLGGWDLIDQLRRDGKIGDFIVLAPSAGHTFYINSENGKVRYEDFLLKEFMPRMEKKYRVEGSRAKRGITGVSMGGYGALRLAFKYPDKFAVVTAQMPALMPDLPPNLSSGAGSAGAVMGDVFGSPFNREYFERNNVFYFARTDSAGSLKKMQDLLRRGQQRRLRLRAGSAAVARAAQVARHPARVSRLSRPPRCAVRHAPLRRRDAIPVEDNRRKVATVAAALIHPHGASRIASGSRRHNQR